MAISVFDLFKIGIGPSSSHTVGPMRAARLFATGLKSGGELAQTVRVKADLYGSLGATGKGHGTDKAVLLGWLGERPDEVDPDRIPELLTTIRANASIPLLHEHPIAFDEKADLVFHRRESLPFHPNGMRFAAFDAAGNTLREKTYYSVGGGFVVNADAVGRDHLVEDATDLRYPFTTGDGLLAQCKASGLSIAQLMLANELRWHSEDEVRANLLKIWRVMQDCVKRGCEREGELPGGMRVKRRAPGLQRSLVAKAEKNLPDPLSMLDWVNLYAMAVNEENAAPLAAVQGGTPEQVENAAEIGMEHNLGLTCDPVGGLVQIPCIERNAMGSVKAINAARMALFGDGQHYVSLDKVIKTMKQTGADMQTKYKETSRRTRRQRDRMLKRGGYAWLDDGPGIR